MPIWALDSFSSPNLTSNSNVDQSLICCEFSELDEGKGPFILDLNIRTGNLAFGSYVSLTFETEVEA